MLLTQKLAELRLVVAKTKLATFGDDNMPDETMVNYRREYEKEQERLTKLWDAYEIQEKDLAQAKDKIRVLEDVIAEKERIILSLRQVAENRDSEIRDLEIRVDSLERANTEFEPKMKELEKELKNQRDQFAKLYSLAEELDEELRYARREIEIRDEWFRDHINVFSSMCNAIKSREDIIKETALKPSITSPRSKSKDIEM